MLIVSNKNNIQSEEVHKHLAYSVNENSYMYYTNQEAIDVIKYSREPDIMLVGFIYSKEFEYLLELDKTIYWVSDIGEPHIDFITSDGIEYKSLLEQALDIIPDKYSVFEQAIKASKKATDYYNFKDSAYLEDLEIDKKYIDMLASKCYNNGDLYLLYEVDPKLKLPIAYSITENKDKAIVVIGSQTRSDDDMLTFYVKGYNVEELANKYEAKWDSNKNYFQIFVPSQITLVGYNLKKYMEG